MTIHLRLFILLLTVAFAAAACSPESSSDDPTPSENNSNTDAGTTVDQDTTNPNPIPDPQGCGQVNNTGICIGNTAMWCDFGVQLNTQSCADDGGLGCHQGACRGIAEGFACGLRSHCADGLVCRRGACSMPGPGQLSVHITGKGSVISETLEIECPGRACALQAPEGTEIRLKAEPDFGWAFIGWGYDCGGATETTTVEIVSDQRQACTATFMRTHATLHVGVRAGQGSVHVDPLDIECTDRCKALADLNQPVTLTALPAPGYAFTMWTCSANREASFTYTANGDLLCFADFHKVETLTVEVTGPGRVTTSTEHGIDCPDACTTTVSSSTNLTLSATPDPEARFLRWEGHCSGTFNTYRPSFSSLSGPYHCRAIFEPIPTYPLTITVVGDGKVTSNPAGIVCPKDSTCSHDFLELTRVTLTPEPGPNSRFVRWIRLHPDAPPSICSHSYSSNLTTAFMNVAIHCTAEFEPELVATHAWQHGAPPPTPTHTLWKPDGTQFAVYNTDVLEFFEAEHGGSLGQIRRFNSTTSGSFFAWHPHGTHIATTYAMLRANGNNNYAIHVYKAEDNALSYTATAAQAQQKSLAWDPTGELIAAGAETGEIRVLAPLSSQRDIIHEWIAHNASVDALAWSPNGEYLASSSVLDGTKIWSTDTWSLLHEFSAPGWDSLDWSHDSTTIAGIGNDQIHVASPDGTQTTSWPATDCQSVSFNPAGTKLVAACDTQWSIWDVANQTRLFTAPPLGTTAVKSAQWNPIDDKILVQYDDDSLRTFHGETTDLLLVLTGARDALNGLAHDPTTNTIYTASNDGFIYGLNAQTGRYMHDFLIPQQHERINAIALSPATHTLLGASDGNIHEWSTQTGASTSTPWKAGDQIMQIALSDDDVLATSLSGTEGIRVWHTRGQPHTQTLTSTQPDPHITWQPGGRLLASTSENTTHLWNTQTGLIEHTWECPANQSAHRSTFSADGQRIAIVCQHKINIWNVATGEPLNSIQIQNGSHIAWRPGTETIAATVASNTAIQLYDATTSKLLLAKSITTASPATTTFLTWSADGKRLLVGSNNGKTTAFDITP